MLVIYGFLTGGIAIFMLYLRYCIKRDKKLPWNRMLQNKIYPIMKKLYSAKEAFENSRKFCEQKIKLCLFIVGIGCLSAFFYEIFLLNTQQLKEGCLIRRNAYGEGNRQVWLWVVTEESGKHEKLKLLIPERAYTEEELADLFKQVPSDLINEILGDNSSLNNVSKELDLVTSLEGYPFQISWSSDSPYLLSESGKIDENRLKEMENAEEGILISLTAELSYEEFTEFLDLYARVYPQPKSDEEQFLEAVNEAVESEDEATRTDEFQRLPLRIGDSLIGFKEVQESDSIYLLLLGLGAGILVYFRKDRELLNREKARNQEMLRDYPKIVNKYALYYNAGMSSKVIWQRICSDYRKEYERSGIKRYVYEEMLAADESMRDGCGEIAAYEKFAARCQLPSYRLFVNLIEQALQKGKENMGELLEKEAGDAFKKRKNAAKKRGEEAGTKLLLPMFLMLFVVLFIVIFPAFFSFGI